MTASPRTSPGRPAPQERRHLDLHDAAGPACTAVHRVADRAMLVVAPATCSRESCRHGTRAGGRPGGGGARLPHTDHRVRSRPHTVQRCTETRERQRARPRIQ
ncbi:hypothetical protein EMIHUDRAFT_441124 [Emiliania huxleyi CCMP1516]|uniref:Uncharacterized protein n=2 Tax=Emiliania huxleyi TaxID=2903 RepID=A0A0D3KGF3_EMIH1|nr:hypothetical protein EMIHUDRAFT_441124 [Emiliania huxleyi CCMP1516]EOD34838.1 hypothetical protein EMIHUDRAFT_441124 [Emiliania huxleyi CCMP1516]|eukprot:XP_005787267.1 hypothetical protein EMIHUDRAFT_441124 [Emiliania huxleyi CCMP1516]